MGGCMDHHGRHRGAGRAAVHAGRADHRGALRRLAHGQDHDAARANWHAHRGNHNEKHRFRRF